MLIVAVVLAVLATLLYPIAYRTREQARRAKCLANLHSLTSAVLAYCMDHDEMFPTPAAGEWQDSDWVYWPAQRAHNNPYTGLPNTPPNPCVGGQVMRYVSGGSNSDVSNFMVCPSDDPPRLHALWTRSPYPYSYTINEQMARTYIVRGPIFSTIRLRTIKHAEQKILMVDESSMTLDDGCWAWQANNAQGKGVNVLSNRHDLDIDDKNNHSTSSGYGNVGFCDGHAAYIERIMTWSQINWDPFF